MKLGNMYINKKLTPITLISVRKNFNTFEPIFENKECDNLVMNYTSSTRIQSKDIPAIVPEIYSTSTGKVNISSLFEIVIANSYGINVHVKKIKSKETICYEKNKLYNIDRKKIVEHLVIHDITKNHKKIMNLYIRLNKTVGEQ